MQALPLAISRGCDDDQLHASPQWGCGFYPLQWFQAGPGGIQEMFICFKAFYPAQSLTICMQKNLLKWLTCLEDRRQSVSAIICTIMDYVADLPKPQVKTEQCLEYEAPGVSKKGCGKPKRGVKSTRDFPRGEWLGGMLHFLRCLGRSWTWGKGGKGERILSPQITHIFHFLLR